MNKTQQGQVVVLTEEIGSGCKTTYSKTICKVVIKLDDTHVKVKTSNSDWPNILNCNINKFRLPKSTKEETKLIEKFENSTNYALATI